MKTHQTKLSQSCREYRAIKAGDLVPALRMTRQRQMQRRNNINHATSAQHAPRISHTQSKETKSAVIKTHQTKLSQSCRKHHAIEAGNLVALLQITRKNQMQRRNNLNHATSAPHAPRTSHTHTKKPNQSLL